MLTLMKSAEPSNLKITPGKVSGKLFIAHLVLSSMVTCASALLLAVTFFMTRPGCNQYLHQSCICTLLSFCTFQLCLFCLNWNFGPPLREMRQWHKRDVVRCATSISATEKFHFIWKTFTWLSNKMQGIDVFICERLFFKKFLYLKCSLHISQKQLLMLSWSSHTLKIQIKCQISRL